MHCSGLTLASLFDGQWSAALVVNLLLPSRVEDQLIIMQFQVMRLPVSAKQAREHEVIIAALFCQGTSPQAENGRRAGPGFGGAGQGQAAI